MTFNDVVGTVAGFLSGKIMVPILVFLGVYFTLRLKGVQFTLFGEAWRCSLDRKSSENGISSFATMMMSTAARVGTGNIVGVCTAICLGGYGALFWMLIMAIFGMATAFAESTLAQIYKEKSNDGSGNSKGGPAYYMEHGLKSRALGIAFSILLFVCFGFGFNVLISYNMLDACAVFFGGAEAFKASSAPIIIGILFTVVFGACIFGGGKKSTEIMGYVTPVMGVIYVIVALVVIFKNASLIPNVVGRIFSDALNFKAIFGGFTGSCLVLGIKRGVFSNEAGLGSAPNAAAAADVSHPVKQGLAQMVSVFIDTIVICTATALMCLCSGIEPTPEVAGIAYAQQAVSSVLGAGFGNSFMAIALILFGFTTLVGNVFYAEPNLKFALNRDMKKGEKLAFYGFCTLEVLVGAFVGFETIWNLADLMNALMAIMNLPVIFILGKQVVACLDDYKQQKAEGKDPEFKAADIGITGTDFWN